MVSFSRLFNVIAARRWLSILLQAAVWAFVFSLPFLLRPENAANNPKPQAHQPNQWRFMMQYGITCLTWIVVFYTNGRLLVPRLLNRRRYGQYAGALLLLVAALTVISTVQFKLLLPGAPFRVGGFLLFYLFPTFFFLTLSTAIAFFLEKLRADRLAKEQENENLKTELLFLRSQVSPHFLFNVLNNMVALARKGSDQLEPSLIRLSSLLRYMLYEAAEEKVPLQKELDYLESYIELQTQRFRKNLQVAYRPGHLDAHYLLEPMLLIPFVENAFKHGASGTPDALIEIDLTAVKGVLHLLVRNRYNPASTAVKDKDSGIGMANARRRLSLLYPDRHTLTVRQQDGWFTVSLTINLH